MKDDDYDYEDEDNIIGSVLVTAFNNNTYTIRTSMDLNDTIQLVVDAGDDLIEGNIEGIEGFSQCGMTKH